MTPVVAATSRDPIAPTTARAMLVRRGMTKHSSTHWFSILLLAAFAIFLGACGLDPKPTELGAAAQSCELAPESCEVDTAPDTEPTAAIGCKRRCIGAGCELVVWVCCYETTCCSQYGCGFDP